MRESLSKQSVIHDKLWQVADMNHVMIKFEQLYTALFVKPSIQKYCNLNISAQNIYFFGISPTNIYFIWDV